MTAFWKRLSLRKLGLVVTAISLGLGFVAWQWGYGALLSWVEGEGFRAMLSHQVSRAMKVEGSFGRIEMRRKFSADAAAFESVGRAGEAIGSLDAYGIRGVFNPWGILRSTWQLDRVDIQRGKFALRLPNDAFKVPLPRGKRPWYANLMPHRFYCGWIECPRADVVFPFQGKEGRVDEMYLTATMVGQDFRYHGWNGTLKFPLLPYLNVDELRVFVTREMADIEYALLSGLENDPAYAEISARVGMREDKSIRAKVNLNEM
ncbi:MAG: hypothetical protein AAF558_07400, partial [Verrucomicrobiota bacterium]